MGLAAAAGAAGTAGRSAPDGLYRIIRRLVRCGGGGSGLVDQVHVRAVGSSGEEPPTRSVSILFPVDGRGGEPSGPPACFGDLNLDQVVAAVVAGRQEHRLETFFAALLDEPEAIAYRHEVFRDLTDEHLRGVVEAFAETMRSVRRHEQMVAKLRYARQRQAWFLDAVAVY